MTEYEKNLNDLFSQLADALQEYEEVLRARVWPDICETYWPELYKQQRLDENVSSFQIKLNKLAASIYDLTNDIEENFNIGKPLEKVDELSKKIQRIANSSVAIKGEIISAQEDNTITDEELKSYDNVTNNLHYLDAAIKEYNKNFEKKLVTIEQARKRFNEELDEMFFGKRNGE